MKNLKWKFKFFCKINPCRKNSRFTKIENKFTPKLISFRQSNLVLQSVLIKSLTLKAYFQYDINPISSNVAILYPLKTSENQRSRGNAENWLKMGYYFVEMK